MDGQHLVNGRRLSRLRREDLPAVAKALVGFERGVVSVAHVHAKQPAYYHFHAKGFSVLVLATDFERIAPLVQNGTLDPQQYPPPNIRPLHQDPDVLSIDRWDPVFYRRVYEQLLVLFPDTYPTSYL